MRFNDDGGGADAGGPPLLPLLLAIYIIKSIGESSAAGKIAGVACMHRQSAPSSLGSIQASPLFPF